MKLHTELIALDIGTNSIKLCSIDPGAGRQGFKVKKVIKEEIPEGLVKGGFTNPTITDIATFSSILERLIKKLFTRKAGFIIGLPDRWVKLHLHEMELTENEKNSTKYLSWRLEKNLPIPEKMDVMVDYQVLGKVDDTEKYRILSASVSKDIIDILSNIVTTLKMEVMAFDSSSLGVFNLYEEVFPETCVDQAVIHCHIGHETTIVKVYHSGLLIYERVIEVGGQEFSGIIADLDEVNFEKAQMLKEKESFFPISREDMSVLIKKKHRVEIIFGNWLRELNVTFRFFQEKFKVSTVPSIFLTGGSSMFEGLPEFLAEYFETKCDRFNPLEEMPLTAELNEDLLESGPLFAPCIGLLAK